MNAQYPGISRLCYHHNLMVSSSASQCGNLKKFSHTIFLQKFRQSNFFTKELPCKLISRKFFDVGVNFQHYHILCGLNLFYFKLVFREITSVIKMMLLSRTFCHKSIYKNSAISTVVRWEHTIAIAQYKNQL